MLRSFRIQNFKSLLDFSLDEMGQFVCLVGLNGSGKTTVLQALDFVAHLATGGLDEWFRERGWNRGDVRSKFSPRRHTLFDLTFDLAAGEVRWSATYSPVTSRCVREEFWVDGDSLLMVERGQMATQQGESDVDQFDYRGSVLSLFREFSEEGLAQLKEFLSQIKSLELLSPHRMRSRSRVAEDVGLGGEKIAGYIHSLKTDRRQAIEKELKKFYPHMHRLRTKSGRAGWTEILLEEDYKQPFFSLGLQTESRHINDGLLRILTLVAQVQTEHQILLFDEIENGINPELAGTLVSYLLEAEQQIMVTTHNPVILNYLPDERAKESVFFLYRTAKGDTKAKRFFDVPVTSEKLEVLGPGEVFLDTSLTELAEELGRA